MINNETNNFLLSISPILFFFLENWVIHIKRGITMELAVCYCLYLISYKWIDMGCASSKSVFMAIIRSLIVTRS